MIQMAVIGSAPMVNQIQNLAYMEENVNLTSYIYDTPDDSLNLVKSVKSDTQIIIFTGPVPYFLSIKQVQEKGIPAVHVPVNELSILFSLYFMWQDLKQKPEHFSIDIPNLEPFNNVLKEINSENASIYFKEHDKKYNLENIVNFHYKLWKGNKIKFVLTSVRAVDVQLKELGVKSLKVIIPQKNVEETFQKALAKGELEVSKESQITVGFFSIDNFNEIASKDSMFSGQEIILKIHKILIEFSKEFHASVIHLGKDQFIIYSTRGGLSNVTNKYTQMNVLSQISAFVGIDVSVGFGFGTTSQEAEQNAYIATYEAKKIKGSNAFIVTDNKRVIGPLNNEYKEYSLRSSNENLLSLSKKTQLSISTLSMLTNFFLLTNYNVFTSHDLSQYAQLSKRSSERILKKLLENNLIKITGTEQPYQKGRPRSVYKVDIENWTKL